MKALKKMEVRNGQYSLTRLIAGIILLLSSALVLLHSPWWSILTGFIGVTHISSATIGFCPMEKFLHHVFGFEIKGMD